MDLYRFSPITNQTQLFQAYEYIADQLEQLSQQLLSESLPITTLKVFAHYPDEYQHLHSLISQLGPAASFNSDTSYYVEVDQTIKDHHISYLGLRIVDPYRLHVGCGDFEVTDFQQAKQICLSDSPYIRQFADKNMLELWHPDFDILGYIIPSQ